MKTIDERCENILELLEDYRLDLENARDFTKVSEFETFREELIAEVKAIRAYIPKDNVVLSVMKKLKSRSDKGVRTYEKSMDRDDLTLLQWFYHHHEELMDGAIYAEKIIQQLEEKQSSNQGD
jgi:hypothetical protein